MCAPWGIRVRDESELTLVAVRQGRAKIEDVVLEAGDVALVRGPDPYSLTDPEKPSESAVILPGQRCVTPDGVELEQAFRRGLHHWGNAAVPDTSLLVGIYERGGELGRFVTAALPRLTVIRRDRVDNALLALLERELHGSGVGGSTVIDRLLDLLVVTAVRASHENTAPSWAATRDPLVISALECFHDDPATPWTVEGLARRLNVSRATLAARFRTAVGAGPIAYLTQWRLALAGELLAETRTSVAEVARRVGYDNAFAFSTAFKRRFGVSPTEHRRRASSRFVDLS